MSYDYDTLTNDLENLSQTYPFLRTFSAGNSLMGKRIPVTVIGDGEKKLFLSGAHHGLEYLTSAFLTQFMNAYCGHFVAGNKLFGYNVRELFHKVALYVMPMVNPDGVDIAIHGLDITNPYHRNLISMVGIHSFQQVWQANARGVDINHNYNADWQMTVEKPAPTKYAGEYAESEPETHAVTSLVREIGFDMLLAFHSQGGEIYYDFDGLTAHRSEEIAQRMAEESGYIAAKPTGTAAFGGCKDWFIKEFGREGFTVEIGHGKNPLPLHQLDEVYEENAKLVLCAMEEI